MNDKGVNEKILQVASVMKQKGVSVFTIAELTGLPAGRSHK
jgi:hypothetical protein